LPADLCLCIENPPTKWDVGPWNGEALEVLPEIADDLLTQVTVSYVQHYWCVNDRLCRRRIELLLRMSLDYLGLKACSSYRE
jgi:hypothetical protein